MRSVLIGCSALLVVLVGCGDSSDSKASGGGQAASNQAPLDKLGIKDTKVGTGDPAQNGDSVYVEYTGKLGNGTVFDSTDKHDGAPFEVPLGAGKVIKGWDAGLVGMKVGGERHLSIPAAMAYGEKSQGEIPANSDLFFDVKMDMIVKPGDENTLQQKLIKPGTGRKLKDGDTVEVDYTGTLLNGKEFDSTKSHGGKPFVVHLGKHEVVPGFEAALEAMKVGEESVFTIPPFYAYGAQAQGSIPPNSWLRFDLKVVKLD